MTSNLTLLFTAAVDHESTQLAGLELTNVDDQHLR
jgi:hypothetical protein